MLLSLDRWYLPATPSYELAGQPQVPHADLIDLLLDADDPTRKLLIFQALQTGALKKSEAEEVIAQVARLERAAAPRSAQPKAAARAA